MSKERNWLEKVKLVTTQWYRTSYSRELWTTLVYKYTPLIFNDIATIIHSFADSIQYPKGDFSFEFDHASKGKACAVRVSNDGSCCFIGTGQGMIIQWDLVEMKSVRSWDASSTVIILMDNRGGFLASTDLSTEVSIWDEDSGELVKKLKGHSLCVSSISFNHDASQFVSASHDQFIRVWNTKNWKCTMILSDRKTGVHCAHILQDQVISVHTDRSIRKWNLADEKCIETIGAGKKNGLFNLLINEDESFAVGKSIPNTQVFLLPSLELFRSEMKETADLMCFHPKITHWLGIVHSAGKVAIYDIQSDEFVIELSDDDDSVSFGGVSPLCFTPDGSRLIIGVLPNKIKLWDLTHLI